MGMPVDEFTEKAWAQLAAGNELVIVGSIGPEKSFLEMLRLREKAFEGMSDAMLGHFEL
jgi:hypothetical protein